MYFASTGQKYILYSIKMNQQIHSLCVYTVTFHANTKILLYVRWKIIID